MKPTFAYLIIILVAISAFGQSPYPGCPDISIVPKHKSLDIDEDTIILACLATDVELKANFLESAETNQYKVDSVLYNPPFAYNNPIAEQLFVNSDDVFSDKIQLPFDFCFYGNTYHELVVGANGFITFDTSRAKTEACWCMEETIPTTTLPTCVLGSCSNTGLYDNSIFGAAHDLKPNSGTPSINYAVFGEAPCRAFVLNYFEVEQFAENCDVITTTQQIVIYETTNVIEVYIKDKPVCNEWNNGNAVIGIMNTGGTKGITPPNRNTSNWTAQNEAWRFTPSGASNSTIKWYDKDNTLLGEGAEIYLPIPERTEVNAVLNFTTCLGEDIELTDKVFVQPLETPLFDVHPTNTGCHGTCNGLATITILDGNDEGGYRWSSGARTTADSNLCAGTYSVTVFDRDGCENEHAFEILADNAIEITVEESSAVTCHGELDGGIELSAAGDHGGFAWSIDNGPFQSSPVFTSLSGRDHEVVVRDSEGCISSTTIFIEEPEPLRIDTSNSSQATCELLNGSINVTASGGTTISNNYQFNWSPSNELGVSQETAPSVFISDLAPNNYTVQVLDGHGCRDSLLFAISRNSNLSGSVEVLNNVKCRGLNDGSAKAIVHDGNAPFEYSWDNAPFQSNELSPNLAPGTHTVQIKDQSNCLKTYAFEITEPENFLFVSLNSKKDPTCPTAEDGKIILNVSGGEGNLTYNWSHSASPLQNQNLLGAGTYEVTVSDENGCEATLEVVLTAPDEITISLEVSDLLCFNDASGSISSSIVGGTPPYNYQWSTMENGPNIESKSIGTYSLTVTDNNNCSASQSATLQEPEILSVTADIVPETCSAENGSISLAVQGGKAPYEYHWLQINAFSPVINNLSAQPYDYNVIDANGCIHSDKLIVEKTGGFDIEVNTIDNKCFGDSTGIATATPSSSGAAPYSYSWQIGGNLLITEQNNSLDELPAGNSYRVSVTDANKCSSERSFNILEPNKLDFSITTFPVLCYGEKSGKGYIDIDRNSGTAPYQISWSDGQEGTNLDSILALGAGEVFVTVVDNNGCSSVQSAEVTSPDPIRLDYTINNIDCYGDSTGQITLSPRGGTGNFTFSWFDNHTEANHDNLLAGNHAVTITDEQNCILDTSFLVEQPASAITIEFTNITDADCFQSSNGSVTAVVTGGNGGYNYLWNDVNNQNSPSATNLLANTYTITITDSKNCKALDSIEIKQPAAITYNLLAEEPEICRGANGQLFLQAEGGNTPFRYKWSNDILAPNNTNLSAGEYGFTITDSKNCSIEDVLTVERTSNDLIAEITNRNDISCYELNNGSIAIQASLGVAPYTYQWSNNTTAPTVTGLSAGVYSVTIMDASECEYSLTDSISRPDSISLALNKVHPSCYNYADGVLFVEVRGGVEPFQYRWNNGAIAFINESIAAGAYQATITDGNGCSQELETHLNNPTEINVSILQDDAEITEGTSIVLSAEAFPVQAYDFIWTPDEHIEEYKSAEIVVRPRQSAAFKVVAMDNNGCIGSDTVSIGVNPFVNVLMATAFTPNGDGLDDYFGESPSGAYQLEHLEVYNRWGHRIYSGSEPWNGLLVDGSKAKTGTYAYNAEVTFTNPNVSTSRSNKINGNVTVLVQ